MRTPGILFCLLILGTLMSCSHDASVQLSRGESPNIWIISACQNSDSKDTTLEIRLQGSHSDANHYRKFVQKSLGYLNTLKPDTTPVRKLTITSNTNAYQVFFLLGKQQFNDLKVETIRYGLIDIAWQDFVAKYSSRLNTIQTEKYNQIRIPEFNTLYQSYHLTKSDLQQASKFHVHYLLKSILFVSIQEFLERPYRYFGQQELNSVFCQIIVLPESREFVKSLVQKYGLPAVYRLGKEEFSKDTWKKVLGEGVNETKERYTKSLEDMKFTGTVADSGFSSKMADLLKFYNSTTKSTLFKK